MPIKIGSEGAGSRRPLSFADAMQRRLVGLERLADRLRAVPVNLRTAWVCGQLRYTEAEIMRTREAIKAMRGVSDASSAAETAGVAVAGVVGSSA